MSHQGLPGWFPECAICGMGNLGGFVCLNIQREEAHGLTKVTGRERGDGNLWEEGGHWWAGCLLCDTVALADPVSWGSVGYCIDCWNSFVERGLYPPRSIANARDEST